MPAVQEQSLEPKDFLASERTFLEWVSTTVMLAVMGIGLWRYSLSLGEAEPTAGGRARIGPSVAIAFLLCF